MLGFGGRVAISLICWALAGFHLENFIRGGSSVITMKGGHDQMKSRCGFYSKLGYCEGVVEEFGGEVGELGGGSFPSAPPSR